MKRIHFTILILLLAVLLPSGISAKRDKSDEKGTPAIEFNETSYDFGTVKASDGYLHHEFVFHNTGTAPLAIVTVSASCGCTKPEFNPKPIAPGDSSKITIRFNPEDFSGEFLKTATVRTNVKGKSGRVALTISGIIIPKKQK